MKRSTVRVSASGLSFILVAASAGQLFGQPPAPGPLPATNPPVSPYINLNRSGASPGINYYGIVRPEFEFRNAFRGLQQQLSNTQLSMQQMTDPHTGFPVTGHTATFLNTGGYFLNLSGGAGAAGHPAGRSLGGAAGGYGMGGTAGGFGTGTGNVGQFQSFGAGGAGGGAGRGAPPGPRR